jgi:hypothetical protein
MTGRIDGITAGKQPIETKNTRHKEVSLLAKSAFSLRTGLSAHRDFNNHLFPTDFLIVRRPIIGPEIVVEDPMEHSGK